jgi:hypothetical protein
MLKFLFLICLFSFSSFSQEDTLKFKIRKNTTACNCSFKLQDSAGNSGIKIRITNQKTGEFLRVSQTVALYKADTLITCFPTLDSIVIIPTISPGNYDVRVCAEKYQSKIIRGLIVGPGKIQSLTIALSEGEVVPEKKVRKRKHSGNPILNSDEL